jgi:hypothetical protein
VSLPGTSGHDNLILFVIDVEDGELVFLLGHVPINFVVAFFTMSAIIRLRWKYYCQSHDLTYYHMESGMGEIVILSLSALLN